MRRVWFAGLALGLAACSGGDDGVFTGYVEAELVRVSAPQPGWVETLRVREGDVVEAGQVLFDLDAEQQELALNEAEARLGAAGAQAEDASRGARPAEIAQLQAQLEDARAQLVNAEAELRRAEPLAQTGALAQARLDDAVAVRNSAQARVHAAEKAVSVARLAAREGVRDAAEAQRGAARAAAEQALWQLGQRHVEARVGGRVERIAYRTGEFVAAGAPVVTLLPEDALKVRFFVAQERLPAFEPGTEVAVRADGLSAPVVAVVSYVAREAEFTPPVIYSAATRDKLVFAVEARLPAGTELNAGLPVDVSLP